MRGSDANSGSLFCYVDLEARVPASHPLGVIRRIADDVLAGMSGAFETAYAPMGRPSIPPERLLRALLLQAFYSIRSGGIDAPSPLKARRSIISQGSFSAAC
jgi:transposase